jgi:hypothetical protein
MTHQMYFFCVLMFILGQALHLFLIKLPSVRERCRAANKPFTMASWWSCDWSIVIGTFVIGCLLIVGLDEIVKWKPGVMDYVKWFFAGMGAFGSTIAMAKMSQFEKSLTDLINIKSNVSDAMTGGTITVKDTIQKGSDATGTDVTINPNINNEK